MQERRKVIALLSVVVFISRGILHWIMFGKVIDDPEFDQALLWAEETGIENIALIKEYPFSPITRVEAAGWYVSLAQDLELFPSDHRSCYFIDIANYSESEKEAIHLACSYQFFKGTNQSFHPEAYVTKATSLVALMRGLFPGREFEEIDPYWDPYVQLAYAQGITKRESSPYMMYLISRYELLLQLWRAKENK